MNELSKPPVFLIGQTLSQLESFAISLGCQEFRGRQLFDWLYSKQVDDYDKMSNLSHNFREHLKEIPIQPLKIINKNISSTKKTQKYLFQLSSGKLIESVLPITNSPEGTSTISDVVILYLFTVHETIIKFNIIKWKILLYG